LPAPPLEARADHDAMNRRSSGRKPFYDAAADDGCLIDTELLSHALAFAAAADAYVGVQQTDWKVVHFLLGRSIELTLKAYALHVGVRTQGLRKIGHDLAAALALAKERGLAVPGLSEQDERSVGVLGALYRDKYLEYPLVMLHAFPRFRIVREHPP